MQGEAGLKAYLEGWGPVYREAFRVLLKKRKFVSVDEVAAELGFDRHVVLEAFRSGYTSGILKTKRVYPRGGIQTLWKVHPRVQETLERVLKDFPPVLVCCRCNAVVERKSKEAEGWGKIQLGEGTFETLCPACLAEEEKWKSGRVSAVASG